MTRTTDAPPGFEYDAFVSYRRGDGGWHARTLRQRLLDIRLPPELTTQTPPRRLRIYLDQIYERATDDFFDDTIKPALRGSRHLVIVQSPSAIQPRADGTSNWLEREIDYFRSLPSAGRSISVAVTSGDLSGPLPASLARTHPNIERLDLRGWRWYRPAGFDEQLLSLAATLYEVSPADMPALRREDARRKAAQRRRRVFGAGAVMALLIAAGGVAWWQYDRARLEAKRRTVTQARAYWDRLDFADPNAFTDDELNALWELALGDPEIRAEFLKQLLGEPSLMSRLGRGRHAILRSLFLRWPQDRAATLFDAALADLASVSDSAQATAVGLALDSLASILSSDEADARVGPLLSLISEADNDAVLEPLGLASQALAGRLRPEEARRTFTQALDQVRMPLPERRRAELAFVAQRAARQLTQDQAQDLFTPVLESLRAGDEQAVELRPYLCVAAIGLGAMVSPEQARAVMPVLIAEMEDAGEETTGVFAELIGTVAPHATSQQAGAAIRAFIRAIEKIDSSSHAFRKSFGELAPAPETENKELFGSMQLTLVTLASRLEPAEAVNAFDEMMTAAETPDPEILDTIDVGAAAVAARVTGFAAFQRIHQLRRALARTNTDGQRMLYALAAGRLADRIDESFVFPVLLNLIIEDIRSSDWRAAGAFALPAQALARRTGPEDAKIFFEELQKLLAAPPSEYHLQPFGNIGKALAERMSAAEARRLLPGVLDEIQRSKDTRRIGALAAIVDGWSAHLTPAQAETLFPTLLSTLTRALNEENGALARSLTAVAATLSEASAQRLLPSMLKLLADDQTGSGDSSAVAAAVGLVTGKVDRAAMAGAVAPMLRVVKIASAGPDQDAAIATLRRVVDAAGGLAPEHLQAIMAEIAWAQTPAVAAVWATALVQVAPRDPPEAFVATVVSALKSPPGAGEATPILLDGLRAAVPAAPGAAAGLHANLEWIARTFPGIDISGQPACPRPPRQGLQCPTVVARPTFAIGQSNVSFQ